MVRCDQCGTRCTNSKDLSLHKARLHKTQRVATVTKDPPPDEVTVLRKVKSHKPREPRHESVD